jgi:hypothetical protein
MIDAAGANSQVWPDRAATLCPADENRSALAVRRGVRRYPSYKTAGFRENTR